MAPRRCARRTLREHLKGNRKYLVVLLLAIALAVYAEVSSPRPVDWSPSYSHRHTIPYGAFVLYELLREGYSDGEMVTTEQPLYSTIDEYYESETTTYFVLNSDFYPDELDRVKLFEYLDAGNVLFLAVGRMGNELADSLGIELEEGWLDGGSLSDYLLRDTIGMNLVSPSLRAKDDYPLRVGRTGDRWFSSFDTSRSVVLGRDANGRTNFLRIEQGGGTVYVHVAPVAFANHNMLIGRNAEYAFAAMSYIPKGNLIWDEYYKEGREISGSPLDVVLRDASLRWVWILTIVGVVLFVLVHARRRQRAIPVIPPPTNTTLEFATTVGRLYYEHGDHRGIARKKVAYFHDYLRAHLGLRVGDVDTDLPHRVAERSGVSEDRIRSIFGRLQHINRAREYGEEDLKGLNADLEEFYTNTKR